MDTGHEALRFGDVLQRSRKRVGLTQEQLAGLSTVSVRAIRDLELGRAHRPRGQTVKLLADALRLSGSPRVLLESAAGRPAEGTTLLRMYEGEAGAPPAPTGPLFGRVPELAVIGEALDRERMVALVGLAGVGKTRLALEAVRRRSTHGGTPTPTVWIPRSDAMPRTGPAADHSRAMFISWVVDRLRGAEPVEELAALIGDRPMVLVIDAYESSPVRPEMLRSILDRCAGLQVLATTRGTRPFAGVRAVPVPPLPLAATDNACGPVGGSCASPAVELLLSHLRYTRPTLIHTEATLEAVAALCRTLDGIPLALDLAAAWFPVYLPEQMVAMVQEGPLDLLELVLGTEPDAGPGFRTLVAEAVSHLKPAESEVLHALLARDSSCPASLLVRQLGLPVAETTRALHALLQRGLIRHETAADGAASVEVLNLVRHVVASSPGSCGTASEYTRP
ncbi:helix-turn-helix domain-containing protein [Streptomyces sp. NPDC088915]|uniref:helix-turn-helix domain-containing protein n=1 Tax=Streptomyces sp. NPDC088915 TaxID=3365912 RepID=UPI0037F964F0